MENKNSSFVFYKSFYDAMQILDNDDKCEFMRLICELAFNENEADLTTSSDLVKVLYTVSAEQIKASLQHKNDGKKGGRPTKEETEKGVKTPLLTPLLTNVNVNDNLNVNVNENVNDNTHHYFIEPTRENLIDWAESNTKFKHYAKNIENIEKALIFLKTEKLPLNYLDYVYVRCLDKYDKKDINLGLIINALSWHVEDFNEINKPKKAKKTPIKKTIPPAPTTCEFCGSHLEPVAPDVVACMKCKSKTFWELENNNVWKCNRKASAVIV